MLNSQSAACVCLRLCWLLLCLKSGCFQCGSSCLHEQQKPHQDNVLSSKRLFCTVLSKCFNILSSFFQSSSSGDMTPLCEIANLNLFFCAKTKPLMMLFEPSLACSVQAFFAIWICYKDMICCQSNDFLVALLFILMLHEHVNLISHLHLCLFHDVTSIFCSDHLKGKHLTCSAQQNLFFFASMIACNATNITVTWVPNTFVTFICSKPLIAAIWQCLSHCSIVAFLFC